ncbi:M61 family metallopeptidase [Pleionea litopenaei]|uniref:PDZ domain-containing protein n=1 Tax=Pleionea litopenaei TaxID=3070815 RepID=A0AA51RVZ9_9GAMM|nr:PDZ domain-containing protein [Pleionea sp. HL-JVS1]WMS88622.1 PDZ domain-containing protein [Pleionea sp. HL-JVS1]
MIKYFGLAVVLLVTNLIDAKDQVHYLVDFQQPQHHLADIQVKFPKHEGKQLDISLPVWRTGRYEILDLSKGIRNFSAFDANGKALEWRAIDKASWRIESNGEPVTIQYLLYANDIGSRTRHIDDTHAFLDATATFVYSPQLRDRPIKVRLMVPNKWRSRSGMESAGKHTFVADNYDVLVDSPIETGIHSFREFTVGDREYELLFWGRGNYDEAKIEGDLAKLDRQVEAIWKEFPYSRYVYMIHATSGPRGATEHINSTVIQRQRDRFGSRSDYLDFMGTAAHELIHTWNVKAYRPAALVPYDYQKESYTPLLWVAEGSTSYYDTLLVRRAEISTQAEFHKEIAKSIEKLLNRPGREVQSVSEASWYSWIESTNDFTINHGVNIYAKGSLVSWLLDYKIREATNNQKRFEDVHRLLFQRFNASEKGFTDEDLLSLVNEVTGKDFGSFWDDYVWGTKPIPFDDMLNYFGLKIERLKKEDLKVDLGIKYDNELVLERVKKHSSAWKSGLTSGDRIVAINKLRLSKDNIEERIEALPIGQNITIQFFRRDELKEATLLTEVNENTSLKIVPVEQPTDQQKEHYQSWTSHPLEN